MSTAQDSNYNPKRQPLIEPGDLANEVEREQKQKIDRRKKDAQWEAVVDRNGDPVYEVPPVHRVADAFLRHYDVVRDKKEFVYVYNQNRCVWEEWIKTTLQACAGRFDIPEHTSEKRRKEIVDEALFRFTSTVEIRWNRINQSEIAFADKIVDVVSGSKRDHRREDYLTSVLPYKFNPRAKCPIWQKCLTQWFESADKISALQEFFGYMLTNHNNFKKALLLIGESNSGKSRITDVALALVGGLENTSAIPLEHMDDPDAVAQIKNKRLNLVTETSVKTVIADGGFKRLVASEPTPINNKYERQETIIPFAKHIIATNTKPRIHDKSLGVFNRLLILKLNRVVPIEEQDSKLPGKLLEETEGILAWAVEGARRLLARGRFDDPAESRAIVEEYKREQDPIESFIATGQVRRDKSAAMPFERLFNMFVKYHGKGWTENRLSRLLHEAGFESKIIRTGSSTCTAIVGLCETGLGHVGKIVDSNDPELF